MKKAIYTPELMEYKEIMTKLNQDRELLLKLNKDLKGIDNVIKAKNNVFISEVYNAVNDDGKKSFTNEKSREAEILKKQRADEDFGSWKIQSDDINERIKQTGVEIDNAKERLRYWRLVVQTLNADKCENV